MVDVVVALIVLGIQVAGTNVGRVGSSSDSESEEVCELSGE